MPNLDVVFKTDIYSAFVTIVLLSMRLTIGSPRCKDMQYARMFCKVVEFYIDDDEDDDDGPIWTVGPGCDVFTIDPVLLRQVVLTLPKYI